MNFVSIPFKNPCNIVIAAESGGGKTCILEHLFTNKQLFFTKPADNLIILYNTYQDAYTRMQAYFMHTTCYKGIPSNFADLFCNGKGNGEYFCVVDDLAYDSTSSAAFNSLIACGRHFNVNCVINLWQGLYPKTRYSTSISQNITGYILLKSARLAAQVELLGRQLGLGGRGLKNLYMDVTRQPYHYLVVDLTSRGAGDPKLQLRSQCFDTTITPMCHLLN